jgi:hypothetical protein
MNIALDVPYLFAYRRDIGRHQTTESAMPVMKTIAEFLSISALFAVLYGWTVIGQAVVVPYGSPGPVANGPVVQSAPVTVAQAR